MTWLDWWPTIFWVRMCCCWQNVAIYRCMCCFRVLKRVKAESKGQREGAVDFEEYGSDVICIRQCEEECLLGCTRQARRVCYRCSLLMNSQYIIQTLVLSKNQQNEFISLPSFTYQIPASTESIKRSFSLNGLVPVSMEILPSLNRLVLLFSNGEMKVYSLYMNQEGQQEILLDEQLFQFERVLEGFKEYDFSLLDESLELDMRPRRRRRRTRLSLYLFLSNNHQLAGIHSHSGFLCTFVYSFPSVVGYSVWTWTRSLYD